MHYSEQFKENYYFQDEELVHEKQIRPVSHAVPLEVYQISYNRETIQCKNLITIQILTRVLQDWYNVKNNEITKHFVEHNIMKLLYTFPEISLLIPDPTQSHRGMSKLLEPQRQKDLTSFQKSLTFLEYYIYKEFSLAEIAKLPDEIIEKYNLDAPLNEIVANSQILFGDNPIEKVKSLSSC